MQEFIFLLDQSEINFDEYLSLLKGVEFKTPTHKEDKSPVCASQTLHQESASESSAVIK